MKARKGAAALMAAAAMAAGAGPAAGAKPTFREKLRALQLPGPVNVQILAENPTIDPMFTLGALGSTIYAPGYSVQHQPDRHTVAHESFHLLDSQALTDANRARLMRAMRLPAGAWRTGTGMTHDGLHSPSELAADWYAAAVTGTDPRKGWDAAYTSPPRRRDLLRFARTLERIGERHNLPVYKRPRLSEQ